MIARFVLGAALAALVGCGPSANSGPAKPETKGVILLRYNQGSESTAQREAGFLNTLTDEYPDIVVLSSEEYSGTTETSSLEKALQMLNKFDTRVEGIFAVCEPNANGVLTALEQHGMLGKVKFVAFDPSERLVSGMGEGHVHGIVLQDPVTMGDKAVRTMVAHLENKDTPIEKRISTGEFLATPENMKTEEMQRLLKPATLDKSTTGDGKKYRLAVIPKGTTHEFWKSVHFGANRAAQELGNVEILWKGPHLENDRDGQISVVQDFITKKVDGIVLAPLDAQALVGVVKEAKEAGIPTVIFDSGLDAEHEYVSYVATDNYQGGVLAARRLAEVLGKSK